MFPTTLFFIFIVSIIIFNSCNSMVFIADIFSLLWPVEPNGTYQFTLKTKWPNVPLWLSTLSAVGIYALPSACLVPCR